MYFYNKNFSRTGTHPNQRHTSARVRALSTKEMNPFEAKVQKKPTAELLHVKQSGRRKCSSLAFNFVMHDFFSRSTIYSRPESTRPKGRPTDTSRTSLDPRPLLQIPPFFPNTTDNNIPTKQTTTASGTNQRTNPQFNLQPIRSLLLELPACLPPNHKNSIHFFF